MSRVKPQKPPLDIATMMSTGLGMVEVVAVLIRTDNEAASMRDNDLLADQITEATDRVTGNRGLQSVVSWEDFRYLLLARLRLLVDYLDGNRVDAADPGSV